MHFLLFRRRNGVDLQLVKKIFGTELLRSQQILSQTNWLKGTLSRLNFEILWLR